MACLSWVPSLQEEGSYQDDEWLSCDPLMAENHKPLLGYVQATQYVKEARGWPGFPGLSAVHSWVHVST